MVGMGYLSNRQVYNANLNALNKSSFFRHINIFGGKVYFRDVTYIFCICLKIPSAS